MESLLSPEAFLEELDHATWAIKTQWDAGFVWSVDGGGGQATGSEASFAEAVRKVASSIVPHLVVRLDAQAASVLQRLYDSEIDGRLGRDASGPWWALGDDWNGLEARGRAATVREAAGALARAARQRFPRSTFASATTAPWRP